MMRRSIGCALLALLMAIHAMAAETPGRGIGMESDLEVVLDRGDCVVRPLDDRTPLILRIESVHPEPSGKFRYDLHGIGFEPGTHRLADYLVLPDGSPVEAIAHTTFEVRSILPPDHDGRLNDLLPRSLPGFGGYRRVLAGLAALWVLGLAGFAWTGRRVRNVEVPPQEVPHPTFAERLRPLVEAAATGELTAQDRAMLERLMTGYWRDRLDLPPQRMADQIATLKRHPQAGELLRAMERWLHQPGSAPREEVHAVLQPYRCSSEAGTEVAS